jgi:hypothetical protein
MKTSFVSFALLFFALATFSAFTPGTATITPVENVIPAEATMGGAYLVFAGKNGGDITKRELRGQTELGVEGCAKGSRVFSFSLEVNRDGKTQKMQAKSNVLSQDMITALASLDTGDSFEFKSMKAYLPNGKDVVDVHGRKFVVV